MTITVLKPEPIPFSALPAALRRDRTVRDWIEDEPDMSRAEDARFRLIRVPVAELRHLASPPEAFLEQSEREYDRVCAMVETFERRGETAVPPIILRRVGGAWTLLDGAHRLSAAADVPTPSILAYEMRPAR